MHFFSLKTLMTSCRNREIWLVNKTSTNLIGRSPGRLRDLIGSFSVSRLQNSVTCHSLNVSGFSPFSLSFCAFVAFAAMTSFLRVISSEEEELYLLDCMAYLMLFMAVCTLVSLRFENVPYGRYASSKYGFPVNVKLAWCVQELPSLLIPLYLTVSATSVKTSVLPNQLLIAMFVCHYIQRWGRTSNEHTFVLLLLNILNILYLKHPSCTKEGINDSFKDVECCLLLDTTRGNLNNKQKEGNNMKT